MKQTLSDLSRLEVSAPGGGATLGGCQEWYEDAWRRRAGCGPTAAAGVTLYLAASRPGLRGLCDPSCGRRAGFRELMDEMFRYVTPGLGGVNTPALFSGGLLRYGAARGVALRASTIEIPPKTGLRPGAEEVRDFLLAALEKDLPVAFLNLSNGSLGNLESWHWVIVVALEPDGLTATIADGGEARDVDLAAWLQTSALGGAFVALSPL